MKPDGLEVSECLRIFWQVLLDGGSHEDAMWAVLAAERQERRRLSRQAHGRAARRIVARVCREMGMSVAAVRRRQTRAQLVVHARWVAMAVLRAEHYSLPKITEAVGLSHHTSVIAGLRRIRAYPDLLRVAEKVRATARAA